MQTPANQRLILRAGCCFRIALRGPAAQTLYPAQYGEGLPLLRMDCGSQDMFLEDWLKSKHLLKTPEASAEEWEQLFLLPQPVGYSIVRLVGNVHIQS